MARTLAADVRAAGAHVPGVVAGAVAAILALALTFAVVLALGLAAAAGAPTPDGSALVDWGGASAAATQWWLLAHGFPWSTDSGSLTMVPWGLTAVFVVTSAAVIGRFAVAHRASGVAAALAYVGGVSAVAYVAGIDAGARGIVIVAVVAVLASGLGMWRAHRIRLWPRVQRFPVATAALRLGGGAALMAMAAGALMTVAWTINGATSVGERVSELDPDPVGGGVLALGETAYVPTLAAWNVAWLSGEGFSVGTETRYAPDELVVGELPDLPILEALPRSSGGPLQGAPLVVVVVGMLSRFAARSRLPGGRAGWWSLAFSPVATASAVALLFVGSRGAAGDGRLASLGPEVWGSTVATAAYLSAGLLIAHAIAELRNRRTSQKPVPAVPRTAARKSPRRPHRSAPSRRR